MRSWWIHMRERLQLAPNDLLRDATYRYLWSSILISSLGSQVTLLAVPLTAAVLLHASPTQMGYLTTLELLPFVLLSLPSGVLLDRMRKLPVYIAGELALGVGVASVPMAWWMGWLTMPWLYTVAFLIGAVSVVAGSASQIVLTQVVARDRLVEAHAKNALASSGAEVAGPAVAGALIRMLGAPWALLVTAGLLSGSATILSRIHVQESVVTSGKSDFWSELKAGLRFVWRQPLLVTMGLSVGAWEICLQATNAVQILYATRTLGMSAGTVSLCFVGLGAGTVSASLVADRISRRIGPGPCLVMGFGCTAVGWSLAALAPAGTWGVIAFALMLCLFGAGAIFIFINFLAIRQAVTPEHLLGRMTSVMRWLIVVPGTPGALLGGWLGEHVSLRAVLMFSGVGATILTVVAWNLPRIRRILVLPAPVHVRATSGGEMEVHPVSTSAA